MTDAIRQVVQLVQSGYVDYKALGKSEASIITSFNAPLRIVTIDTLAGQDGQQARFGYVPFPRGSRYAPVSYSIGAGYVSKTAQNIDMCYRLLTTLGSHPELFQAMPTRVTQLNNPVLKASHGAAAVAFYAAFAKQLARPDAVYLPTINGTPFQGFIMERILYKALDNVILNASDLATELRDAQQKETGFLGCLISVLTPVPGDDLTPFVTQIDTCAAKVGAN